MQAAALLGVMVALAQPAPAPKPADKDTKRFGIELDRDGFPQTTPKDTLRSVLKAADAGRFDYLVAHLAEPSFVDQKVQESGGFDPFVAVVKEKWTTDPENAKELRRFLADGVWEQNGDAASAKLGEGKSRQVFFKKIGNRWFLENRRKAEGQP